MIPSKIEVSKKIRDLIQECRKETGLSSYDYSEQIGKSKYWLANIESKKVKYIAKKDLISIIKVRKNTKDEEIEVFIENVLKYRNENFFIFEIDKKNKPFNKQIKSRL